MCWCVLSHLQPSQSCNTHTVTPQSYRLSQPQCATAMAQSTGCIKYVLSALLCKPSNEIYTVNGSISVCCLESVSPLYSMLLLDFTLFVQTGLKWNNGLEVWTSLHAVFYSWLNTKPNQKRYISQDCQRAMEHCYIFSQFCPSGLRHLQTLYWVYDLCFL